MEGSAGRISEAKPVDLAGCSVLSSKPVDLAGKVIQMAGSAGRMQRFVIDRGSGRMDGSAGRISEAKPVDLMEKSSRRMDLQDGSAKRSPWI